MATSKYCFFKIFFFFFFFFISPSIAHSSFTPKALVLPLYKDVSTSLPQYLTQIHQRTPLRAVNLTVDLGGAALWVNCEAGYNSSTAVPARCGSRQCALFGPTGCGEESRICGRPVSNTVTGVSTFGDIYSDVIAVASTNGSVAGRRVKVPEFLFICGSNVIQQGLPSGVKGMAGLGRTNASLPLQLSSHFNFPPKFAVCLASSSFFTGVIFFGDGPYVLTTDVSQTLTFTPLLVNPVNTVTGFQGEPSAEYFIGVTGIRVGENNVTLNSSLLVIDENGIGGTKISSVNPYSVLESTIYKAVSEAFVNTLGVQTVTPIEPFGTCFRTQVSFSQMGPSVPTIRLVLQNEEVVWNIIGANSMVQVTSDVICLGFVDAGSNPSAAQVGFVPGGSRPVTSITIGAHQLENNLLQFDLGASRLGFSSLFLNHTNCANFRFSSA
ncbi:Basic 7S globulin [Senna tora]|uniref:Basic 7S globulin n=1 Tax=Senna tora TaxID=362788 RepID=A0A834SMA1_9FABA|nr:Basic 7S globulin [Senna tora]